MTAEEMVTVPRGDLAVFLHCLELCHEHVRISAEIIRDLVPLRDGEGDLNFAGRHLRFLAAGIEEAVDERAEGLQKMMKYVGMKYGAATGHIGGG